MTSHPAGSKSNLEVTGDDEALPAMRASKSRTWPSVSCANTGLDVWLVPLEEIIVPILTTSGICALIGVLVGRSSNREDRCLSRILCGFNSRPLHTAIPWRIETGLFAVPKIILDKALKYVIFLIERDRESREG